MTNLSVRFLVMGLLAGIAAGQPAPVTSIVLGPQPPFGFAWQMAVSAATNRIYVLNSSSAVQPFAPSIAIVNPSTASFTGTLQPALSGSFNLVAMNETRNAVKGFAVNPATSRVYVAYSSGGSSALVAIDGATDTLVSTVNFPGSITNIAVNPSNNKIYALVSSTGGTQALVLDGSTLAQTAAIAGLESGPLAINSVNNKIYAAAPGPSFGVAIIDGASDAVTGKVSLPVDTYDLLVNPVTNNVYAKPNATQASPDLTIYKIDGVTDQLTATIGSPFAPTLGFGPNFNFVNTASNTIYSGQLAINGATNAVTPGLPVFQFPFGSTVPLTCQSYQGLAVDFAIGNMYGGCDGDLIVADTATGVIKALVPVNYVINWTQLVINPANHAVYGMNGSSVAILDPVALTTNLVQLSNLAGGVAANPVSNQVYVTDESSSAAVSVNGATNAVTAKTFVQIGGMINSAFVPEGPLSIAVNTAKNQYIIAGNQSGMVLDGATNAPLVPIRPQLVRNATQVPIGFNFLTVNEAANKMYSTDNSNDVYVTDLSTGAVSTLAIPFLKPGDICSVHGLAYNAAKNWVYATANCSLATPVVFVYDGTTGATVQTVDLGAFFPLGAVVGTIALNPKSNKLYVTNYGGSATNTATPIPPSTEVFNAATFAHLASIAGVSGPLAIDTVLNAIYSTGNSVPLTGGSNVGAVIDGSTDTLSSTFPLGFVVSFIQPAPIAVNEATHMVYYANSNGTVSVLQGNLPSPGTFSISGQLTGGGGAGVTMVAQGGSTFTAVTDATGAYTLTGLPAGAYTVTPSTPGLFYSPASQSVNITVANVTGVNFAALSTPITVNSLTLAPWTTIGPGVTTTATVTLNQPAPAGGIVVSLSASNTKPAKVPASVTVPAGSTSGTFNLQGNSVSGVTTITITAAYAGPLAAKGSSASTSLTVSPSDSLKIQSATYSKSSQILQVSATSTNPQSILQLFLASNNSLLGTFTSQGNGSYSIQVSFTSGTPASVNVKSNLGGSTGQGVTVTP